MKKKNDRNHQGIVIRFLVMMTFTIIAIPVHAEYLSLSADENCIISSVSPSDHEIVQTDMAGSWALILSTLTSLLPQGSNIDALDLKSESSVYFSLDADTMIAGYVYADEDIIYWNGSALSPVWDGSSNGLPATANLDALHVSSETPLEFLFSLDANADLSGVGEVCDEDIISFATGSGFVEISFDGSVEGISRRADLDGLTVLSSTQWLLSFDVPLKIGSLEVDDADIIELMIISNP